MSAIEPIERTPHLDDHACADLVLGLLPPGERAEQLAHAAACPECEARLRAHAATAERAAYDRPRPAPARLPRVRRHALVLAAAAALAVVLALPLLRLRAPGPAGPPLLPAPGEPVRTREGSGEDPHLTAGLAAYARHDLATAERELAAARPAGGAEPMRRIYLADVRLARGDAAGAASLLRGLAWLSVPEPWRRDAARLYARALRGSGNGVTADSIERALRALPPGTPFVP